MVKKITAVTNPTVVEYAKLSNSKVRFLTGLFSVEGEKSLEDILNANIEIKDIFVSEEYDKIDKLPQDKVTIATEAIMKKLSSSDTPPKVITVASQRIYDMFDLKGYDKLLLLDGISDPGNMGTIIRSAVAFGFEGILLNGNCVDIYNPKVIRSSAGNFFKIPIARLANPFILKEFYSYQFIATDIHDTNFNSPEEIILWDKIILILGSEANGISEEILQLSHYNTKISTCNVESLNLATAASIIMYEFSKRLNERKMNN
ncbi:RNA methyltransferase [bacterium]|nr:RNA methyltransferase [bacterium]